LRSIVPANSSGSGADQPKPFPIKAVKKWKPQCSCESEYRGKMTNDVPFSFFPDLNNFIDSFHVHGDMVN